MKVHSILICDNVQDVLELTRLTFEQAGAEVYAVDSGKKAVELYAQLRKAKLTPQVALIDAAMPEMNGLSAIRRMHDTDTRGETTFLVYTGYDQRQAQVAAIGTGAEGIIGKTTVDAALVSEVERLIDRAMYRKEQNRLARVAKEKGIYLSLSAKETIFALILLILVGVVLEIRASVQALQSVVVLEKMRLDDVREDLASHGLLNKLPEGNNK